MQKNAAMSDVAGMEGLPVSSAITEWRATDAQRRFSISSNETLNVASRWREFLCEVYYPMDAYRIDKSHFHGKLDEIQLDFLQITTFEADRQQVERTRFHTKLAIKCMASGRSSSSSVWMLKTTSLRLSATFVCPANSPPAREPLT